jgi:hypothetical protein
MGVQADIREEVRKETITKIHGQPTNQDLTLLETELIAILANIPTTLGGGNRNRPSKIPSDDRSTFRQSSQSSDIPSKRSQQCGTKISSESGSRVCAHSNFFCTFCFFCRRWHFEVSEAYTSPNITAIQCSDCLHQMMAAIPLVLKQMTGTNWMI